MMISSSYTVIKARSVEETARFYEEYFGFERSFTADWYISLRNGASELAVLDPNHESVPEPFRGRTSNQGVLLNFETDEVDEIFDHFVADERTIHLTLRDEPWGQRHFIAEDPSGIPVDVIKVIPPTAEFAKLYPE